MSSAVQPAISHFGLESIDEEHRDIIQLVHEFDALLCEGGTADQIIDLFAVVLSNIKLHFEDEERLMLRSNFADFQSHKTEHDCLLDELNGIMKDCERGAYADRHQMLAKRITDWFKTHLKKMDAPMIEFEHRQQNHH
ncbi:MAG: hemerythrin family protein [Proteobacteria bacterium]|nr:hemerythrin family protein [Pseudomonadota bacterium]